MEHKLVETNLTGSTLKFLISGVLAMKFQKVQIFLCTKSLSSLFGVKSMSRRCALMGSPQEVSSNILMLHKLSSDIGGTGSAMLNVDKTDTLDGAVAIKGNDGI